MTIEDVKFSIKNHILNSISHRDLCALCNIFTIPITSLRKQNQKNLLDSILLATDLTLLHHILYMLNRSNNGGEINPSITPQMRTAIQNFAQNSSRFAPINVPNVVNIALNLRLYCLSDELMDSSPIDIRSELVPSVNPQNIFIPNFTKYPNGYFNAPSCQPSYVNGRANIPNSQLPYISKNTTIKSSPFYCCQLVLHPLSLLIPKPTPNICQPNRVMSKMQLSFTLSKSVRELLNFHRCQINNKRIYKWQILLRFGVYDPSKPFPSSNDDDSNLLEYIPPYLSISVNNVQVPLWDILPSNNPAKEGKRHSRPINISDYIKYSMVDEHGYLQIINVNWWQTPGVYLYYYAAVFLERKLDVNELLNHFIVKTHSVQKPMSFTLDFIREKFSNGNNFQPKCDNDDDNDDDLIISSVLPITLQCPVGKSRITCPLRSIHCQHLQCFDANLYLMMNERRSVWKCPVCDGPATLSELFVDEYFLQILKEFEHDEEITEVNVNPDGTYVPVAVKESREGKQHVGNIISNVIKPPEPPETESDSNFKSEKDPFIVVESDDEERSTAKKGQILNSVSEQLCSSKECGPVKIPESSSNSNQPQSTDTDCTIDLTSDTEDDLMSNTLKDPSSLNGQHPLPSALLASKILSVATQSPSKILPKPQQNLSQSGHISSLITENFSLAHNSFQRIPNNNRLLLPANKPQTMVPNMMWMPNQIYPYLYPNKDTMNKYISQSFFPNQKCSLSSSQSQSLLPGVPQRCLTIDTASLVCQQIKVDPYHSITTNNGPLLNDLITSPKKAKVKKRSPQLPIETQGFRRSSRIQHQDKKKYIESSGSSDDDVNEGSGTSSMGGIQKKKRDNPCYDSESSDSSFSNRKKRKLANERSADEENKTNVNSNSAEDILRHLKYAIICVPKLGQDL